jgi:scyllo-inositol 2-dehydrogenase (NADP+)
MAGSADCSSTIADPTIDLIVVATPDATHYDLAEAALKAGKHVVVDKPFTTDGDGAERLIQLAARTGKVLTPFHNRRWDGDFLTVAEVCRSGSLGEIAVFEAHWDRFQPEVAQTWREVAGSRAGTLWNLGPHLIDQALMLFGMPEAIQADIAAQRTGAKVDDYFLLTLHYGKMRAILGSSNLVHAARPRFAVHGHLGSFVKFGLDAQEQRLKSGGDPRSADFALNPQTEDGMLSTVTHPAVPVRTAQGAYLEFYSRVAQSIAGKGAPPVDPRDALQGVRLIELAEKAAETGKILEVGF